MISLKNLVMSSMSNTQAVEITMTDYHPSDMDILYAGRSASSKWLSSMEFSFPQLADKSREKYYNQHNPWLSMNQRGINAHGFYFLSVTDSCSCTYQLIGVHPSILGGNYKFLELFEDVHIVLFCVSLTDYDEFEGKNGVLINNMVACKQLFETIVTDPIFEEKEFLLILNKYDLFEEKIEQVPLTRREWFHDFDLAPINTFISSTLAQCAFQYIAVRFQKWFFSLTNKKLYVSPCKGLKPESVDKVLRYAREILESAKGELTLLNSDDECELIFGFDLRVLIFWLYEFSSSSNDD